MKLLGELAQWDLFGTYLDPNVAEMLRLLRILSFRRAVEDHVGVFAGGSPGHIAGL
jgi:hypothetical protein